jgi:proline iminopeptidase
MKAFIVHIIFIFLFYPLLTRAKPYVEVNGVHLWYQSIGSGEPIVFIAGGPGFSHVYLKSHFYPLSHKFRLIFYDGVGRGRSGHADENEYSIERDVADLEGLREALGITKWHIYGHSYGGVVAQQYALSHQDKVHTLILSNTMHSGEMWQHGCDNFYNEIKNQYPESWKDIERSAKSSHNSSIPQAPNISVPTMPLIYFYDISNLKKLKSDSVPWNDDVYYSIVGRDVLTLRHELKNLDFRPYLKKLKMPTLILVGRFDRMALPRYQLQYTNYAPHAEIYIFEKSGHFPFLEESSENIRVIQEFLRRGQE